MKRFVSVLITLVLLATGFPSFSSAQPVSNCRLKAGSNLLTSLGFPLRAERLVYKENPRILVMPFRLKGEPKYSLTDTDRELFDRSAKAISDFSSGKNTVSFVFGNTIDVNYTAEEFDSLAKNNPLTFQKDWKNSTFGFVEKIVQAQDQKQDYSGIDAVVLYSASTKRRAQIAEALMYTNDKLSFGYVDKSSRSTVNWWYSGIDGDNWFDPIQTAEGEISNAVLIYNQMTFDTLLHEIMHLYGLPDLYGSIFSPPDDLMSVRISRGFVSILAWQQWLLGWLPDENVKCISEENDINLGTLENRFSLDYSQRDQLLVIQSSPTTATVVDIVKRDNRRWLYFYSLDIERSPGPISAFSANPNAIVLQQSLLYTEITNRKGVGTQIDSPNYRLLITDNDSKKISFVLIPSSISESDGAKELLRKADNLREENIRLAQAELEAVSAQALKPKVDADALKRKLVITCTRGKSVKLISSVKPKCPKGYRKK